MTSTDNRDPSPVRQGLSGVTTFAAAVLLFVAGLLAFLQGLSAVLNDELFVVGPEYTYAFDTTTWGWIHLVVGILGILISIGMMTGATWARVSAIVIAGISIVANFLWLPYYPWWSILIIALDVIVIWAVTTWRTD
ncbi:hypothetical protein L5G32_12275 [Gordonia sp. HY002]|uniref:DUF7144 family membrane protein n=1 Tax=Gordonia zhenghanii TaxID=2911516 RepID=UPI001EF03A94|nr:hypothetical protein [Gordonia zhenghanii]MCF8571045.1 hypothetical protein [Gordonia zhenghanii]MCF8606389.1 hypothetical protein [Gordonia zhenghanii]